MTLQWFGPYRVRRSLSAGGMGVLYEAEHGETGAAVAIKTVDLIKGATLAGIRGEVHALASLRHRGVVRILSQGVAGGCPWYAMELLEGRTLADYRGQLWGWRRDDQVSTFILPGPDGSRDRTDNPPIGPAATQASPPAPAASLAAAAGGRLGDVLFLMLKLCAPLAHVHGRGLVHRDLKPENVIVGRDGTPTLFDFGLVSRFPGSLGREVLENAGAVSGTLAYMPPEQIRHEPVDARADLYAFGCILHELVTGHRPFTARMPQHLLEQHLYEQAAPAGATVSGVPRALDELILRLLSKRPKDRLGHARDVALALAQVLTEGAGLGVPRDEVARALADVPATTYLYRAEMVGRQRPLAALCRHVDQAAGGGGAVVLLAGESGLGKTMLASELGRAAALRYLRVVTAECTGLERSVPGSLHVPLYPFRPVVQALADQCREQGPEWTARLLGPHARLLAHLNPTLTDLPGAGGGAEAADLEVETARNSVLTALTETLFAWSHERPLVLIVDDIQWADEMSLALLQSLTPAVIGPHPLFVLATYRSEEVSRPLQRLLAGFGGERLELQRLDDEGVSAMLAELLGLERAPGPMSRFLSRTCGGNPFFVTEYVRAAVGEGLLLREEGKWRLAAAAESDAAAYEALPLPGSLDGLIRRRLSALSPDAARLAELAALVGREVDESVMTAVMTAPAGSEGGGTALGDQLGELVERHVLERPQDGPLRFGHDKVRELTYAAIEPERRRALHGRVGDALERLGERSPYRLAHHFRAAGRVDEAFRYSHAAGRDALRAGAYHEAHEQLTATLALESQLGPEARQAHDRLEQARLRRYTGEAATAVGDMARGEQLLGEAYALVAGKLPGSGVGWTALLGRELVRQALHRALPERWLRAAPRQRAALEEAAQITGQLGFAYLFRNQPLPMLAVLARCANVAESAEVLGARATPYAIFGTVLGLTAARPASRWYFRQARQAAIQSGDLSQIFHQAQIEGFFHVNQADWARARAVLEPELERSRLLAVGYEGDAFRLALASLDILTGNLEAAYAHLEAVASTARTLGNKLHEWWGRKYEAICLLHRGQLAQALAVAAPAEQGFRERGNVVDWLAVLAVEALAHARLGALEAALAKADKARDVAARHPNALYHTFELHSFLPEVYLQAWAAAQQRGDRQQARQARARAGAQIAASARFARVFPIGAPMLLRHRARRDALEGRPRLAGKRLRASAARAASLGMPLEHAFALLELAAEPTIAPPARAELVGQVTRLLSALGCGWHLQRASVLADELAQTR